MPEDELPDPSLLDPNIIVYQHEARQAEFELATGDSGAIDAITTHIEAHFGPIENVYHEILSDLVHIDVHHVAPRPGRLYHTLITSGMSDKPMATPPGAERFRYAEVLLYLPYSWKLSDAAFQDEANYWPIRLLKMLARFPHEYQTWLGVGHTVPNQNPMEPYSAETKLCCALLVPSDMAGEAFFELTVSPGKTIHFLTVWPLYAEEMGFKLKHGMGALGERFEKNKVTEIIDTQRKNVCKPSLWPF